ncbi:hypothetical protein ACMYSQ_001426 [Aspergillus niger]
MLRGTMPTLPPTADNHTPSTRLTNTAPALTKAVTYAGTNPHRCSCTLNATLITNGWFGLLATNSFPTPYGQC